MTTIYCLHGPNLDLLGQREPERYGRLTLAQIDQRLGERAAALGVALVCGQYNGEGALVEAIHAAGGGDGLLINAAAYTHTSVAVRDALLAIDRPFIEVHLSNVFARDPFRHRSYLSDIAAGVITGLGADSYLLALDGLVRRLRGEA
ncbi:MAG: 3-dehydroquinate dehydratase [Nitrospirae bacterium CG18_big_fil_WC_8_21_14_2_50_70_55]|nr:3-dehydroquinate dehydratase [Deltaproteobacteria bacterium]OIP64868.1 MAG: 3-dehydroquinate dehydratase [Nitrospirae bacterium CG2_30_70_394]PIQ06195.1 MAG: 3-dehydroquinate dehydratase [Nitrospirae bacterium CG18_big_fil_WC_8_21_14_2_50_70_55]PIU80231.1 MAG: 3-dehydroquinate dehydratase [Nitrospirae bacterium CG06_land_8_20_14_3_00_70_43]PIW83121.1 MAG: 3-dehydroquinate dehydratase [Nitrospirae bacterium CG_4_8_14_3_um_filter_70_85]PIX83973.1 MAG: 3-dehydroquinate dehydratase [Nitrospirae